MTTVIVSLSDAKKGHPLTCTRPYALLPICNKPVIQHLLEKVDDPVVITDNKPLQEFLKNMKVNYCERNDKKAKDVLSTATIIIPGDIIPTVILQKQTSSFIATKEGSDEEGETDKLLKELKIIAQKERVVGFRINYPWEILTANQHLSDTLIAESHTAVSATVEENVVMKGNVIIGKDTLVKAGSYIEGPVIIGDKCEIGPQAHIRPYTSIGNKCKIGKTEVVDSVIMENSVSKHHGYIGHSVLGEDVNFGALSVTSDYRHDGKNHTTVVQKKKIETERRKLGAFIGDHARIAIQTSFYPGRKMWPKTTTLPGEVITKDKVE